VIMEQQKENEILRLVDSANVPIIGTDMEGTVTVWNQQAVSLSGFSKSGRLVETL
jgi:PAS domain-containing protein